MLRGLGFSFVGQLFLASMLIRPAHAQATEQQPAIVFIAPPGLTTELTEALDEAVSAQVSLVGARLVFLTAADDDAGLEERMTQAEALAREHDASGVFWIDARPSRRWFLYIMDRNGAHVVVRPLSAEGASMDAAIEAAAVIAGSATDALIKQQSIETRLPASPPPPPPAAPPDDALRLDVGYAATLFAPSIGWVHGLVVGASGLWPSGPYVGVNFTWSPPVRYVDKEVTFELARYPIWLYGGVRIQTLKGLELGGELALGLEVRTRTTTAPTFTLDSTDRTTRGTYLTSVRLAVSYRITEWLSLFGRASPELVLNNFDYKKLAVEPGNPGLTYLSPYQLRFTGQIGLAIIR